jgi:predicted PurR-regulated permease PerM
MNKERRNRLTIITEALQSLPGDLQNILDEEQSAFDNLPESLQQSEKGQAMETAINDLDSAVSLVEEVILQLQEAAEQ